MYGREEELEAFKKSLADYAKFPDNVFMSNDFPHSLDLYRTQLDQKHARKLFQRDRAVFCVRDLAESQDGKSHPLRLLRQFCLCLGFL